MAAMNRIIKVNDNLSVVLLQHKRLNFKNDMSIVLCAILNRIEYVTWIMNSNNDSMYHGHYFMDLLEALQDFNSRT